MVYHHRWPTTAPVTLCAAAAGPPMTRSRNTKAYGKYATGSEISPNSDVCVPGGASFDER